MNEQKCVRLKCNMCWTWRYVERDPTDPPNTAMIETPCEECGRGGFSDMVTHYYNASGEEIGLDGVKE